MFDLPPMAVRVTEHQLVARRCGCGATTGAAAPEGVTAPVSYGPRITAVVLYLYVGQFLATKRAAQAMAELFGTPVSEGTVSANTKRAADGLSGFIDTVKQQIAAFGPQKLDQLQRDFATSGCNIQKLLVEIALVDALDGAGSN